jgi:predicted GNAT family acetyltransferase
MKTKYIPIPLHKNEEKNRFEMRIDGSDAIINYKETPHYIALIHTEVDTALNGKGAASAVVEKTLEHISQTAKTLLPYCPYVFAYIQKHPEWKRIVDPQFEGYDKL